MSEANHVLTSPSLPAELHESFPFQVLHRQLHRFHPSPVTYQVEVLLSLTGLVQTQVGLCSHQQHISKAEQHDVVVHQLAILRGDLVYLIFLHACSSSLHVVREAQVHLHLVRIVHQLLTCTIQHGVTIEVIDGASVEIHVKAVVNVISTIAIHLQCLQRSTRAVLACKAIGCSMTIVVGAMYVLLLVRIEVLVHGDDEDIFF